MVFKTAANCRQAESTTGIRRVGLVWEIGGGNDRPHRHIWGRRWLDRRFSSTAAPGCAHFDILYYYD
jgi:hypothetical protein